jgi:hypothetical protein
MERRSAFTNAQLKDVHILLSKEECVRCMVRRSNYAAVMDAQTKQSVEECALGMGQHRHANNAAPKDVQIKSSVVEYVGGMVQRSNDDATEQNAQITSSKEECAESMGPTTNNYDNLL